MRLRTQSVGGEFFVRTLANLQPETWDAWHPQVTPGTGRAAGMSTGVSIFSRETMWQYDSIQDAIRAQNGRRG